MVEQLLSTKFHIPSTRKELVSRPRLIEQLVDGSDCKLTLISAPAGFGKTTLVSAWVDALQQDTHERKQNENRIAWLSLDERDNDQTRFLVYLIAALRTIEENIASGILSSLQSLQSPPFEATLTTLINEITAIRDGIVLVLDDYHQIETPSIHDAITFLLEHLPPQLRLVIATREDPPISLARLRAHGQLTELRANDLRFTSSEAAEFLNRVMGLNLSAEDVATLETRTEGWIAGLQLAAISMQRHEDKTQFIKSFTGSHRLVLDYLIEEVLSQQPQHIQEFLLQTAIFDRLCGSLSDTVRFDSARPVDQPDGHTILEMLENANLFIIPLDDERCWYRYHHLFADLLRNRLRQDHAEMVPLLYKRAAVWFEKYENLPEAIENFLMAGEFQRAAEIIKLGINTIFKQQISSQPYIHSYMLRWLENLPEEVIHNDPRLSIFFTQSAWFLGRREITNLEVYFLNAQIAYERHVASGEITPHDQEYQMMPFNIYVGRSKMAIYKGDHNLSIELAKKALAINIKENPPALVDAYTCLYLAYRESGQLEKAMQVSKQMISVSQPSNYQPGIIEGLQSLGFMLQSQGCLKESAQTYQQAIQYVEEHNLTWMAQVPVTYIKWSHVCYYQNDLAQAEVYILKAIELSEKFGISLTLNYGKIYLAQLRLAQGRDLTALETIQEVVKSTRQNQISAYDIEINAHKAWIQARLGNLPAATAWLESTNLQFDERLGFLQGAEGIQAAHVKVALGQIEEALKLLTRLEVAARNSGNLPYLIEVLVIQASIWHKKGETSKALEVLEDVLNLAASEGFLQVFLNEGPPMARLLYEALSRGIAPEFVRRLLVAFPSEEERKTSGQRHVTKSQDLELIEPLSDRELEVLQLVAEGLTSREIATRLYLSPNTIKVHTRNINGKLGVNNRAKAVIKARTLGILSST